MFSFLRRIAPEPVKAQARRLRDSISPPPIDSRVLFDYQVEAEINDVPRLTMVFQYLAKGSDFGGAATAIDLFVRIARDLGQHQPVDIRFIVTDADAQTDPDILIKWAAKAGLTITTDQIELVTGSQSTIRVRPKEIFFTIIWWNTVNFANVRAQQVNLFGSETPPIMYLIQDYEPGFSEFSSAHLLAHDAFNVPEPLWGIVNSSSLAKYLELVGQLPQRHFIFDPIVVDALRPYLAQVAHSQRRKRILVYGRPTVARNCFPATVRALQRWASDFPEFADWEVVSAGAPHSPVPLGDGRMMTSMGKMSLDDYAGMLLESSVGLSLMASPHPSYPPLEMAHFGLRTVTNTFICKNLSGYHPNILSVRSISDATLASSIAEACRLSARSCDASANPEYVREQPYPFLGELGLQLHNAFQEIGPGATKLVQRIRNG